MTVERTLMIARMEPGDAGRVADLFAASDASELPHRLGVRHRQLFHLHGVYAHLIEAEPGLPERLRAARQDAEFVEIRSAVDRLVTPWSPDGWRGPLDSRATPFYRWSAS
jgi:hypothetical protein